MSLCRIFFLPEFDNIRDNFRKPCPIRHKRAIQFIGRHGDLFNQEDKCIP